MKILTLLLLVLLCSAVSAQTTLKPGTPIERELRPEQLHQYTVELLENQFIQMTVDQREIDVIVRVFSPSGKDLGQFDSPNGDEGPEHFSFVAVTAGKYTVSVSPLNPKDAVAGRYEIKIVELRRATDQELKTSKNLEVTKAKGIALLADIEAMTPQIKSAHARVKVQLQAAQLLWDIDQKRASALFAGAAASFNEFFASIDPDSLQYLYPAVGQLRFEIVQALAPRDPDAALSFLQSSDETISSALDPDEVFKQESALQLTIADQIMRKNPKRALQMARQNLKHGFAPALTNTLSELIRQDPESAAELANEIAMKVAGEKLLKRQDAAYVAANLLRFIPQSDVNTESTNGAARPPVLSEDRIKELIQKVFDEAISYTPPNRQTYDPARDAAWNMLHALKSIGPRLDAITPGGSAAVDKKFAELNSETYGTVQTQVSSNSEGLGERLETIGKMPAEQREQQYIQLAYSEGNNGDLTRAREIVNERVTNPFQRRQALKQLDQQEMYHALSKGKVDDVMRILSGFRNSRERAQQLTQIAMQIGPGLKRATAMRILDQARNMLATSLQAENGDQMQALLEVARAFTRYDVNRSFEIIDPLVEQFNAMTMAARTLNGFGQDYYYDEEELDFQNGNPVANVLTQISSVLGSTAIVNFDRTKVTADRIRAPEARLKIYLDIAQQTIQASK